MYWTDNGVYLKDSFANVSTTVYYTCQYCGQVVNVDEYHRCSDMITLGDETQLDRIEWKLDKLIRLLNG